MKQVLFFAAVLGSLSADGAKVKSLDGILSSALEQTLSPSGGGDKYRPTEEDIQFVLSHAREGGDGLSRIEVKRIRVKDEETGEEFDDVFVNETSADEPRSICQEEGYQYTPSAAVLQTAQRVLQSEAGVLLSSAVAAYIEMAEYFGQELFHMEAPVGSETPIEEPHGEKIVEFSTDWSEELNALLTQKGADPCPNSAEWLLFCIKKTTCLLEAAVEADPHVLTPGRMATYLEVAKEVQDHYEEFAIMARLGLPHQPELCSGEEASTEMPQSTSLMQLKKETEGANSERHSRAVEAVVHTQQASVRTVQALSDHSKLHLLETSFFARTWKKACELIECKTISFVDIMDASAGHTAELVDVKASWHAVKTHHTAFMQFRTSVWSAMNASAAFHDNFTSFIYEPGRTKGSRRTDPIYKETSDVLSTAMALKRRYDRSAGNDNGKNIKRSGWWCFSWRATATGSYAKKFPSPQAQWGVATGFKLLTGSTTSLKTLMSQKDPGVHLKTSIGLTIGFVPDMPGVAGVRAGVSVGGTVDIQPGGVKFSISLGLGMSASTGNINPIFCGGPAKIGIFACKGSVASAFTLFCKEFNFVNGENGAAIDDPCATGSKVYVQNHRRRRRWHYDMPGQGRTTEKKAEHCRERCKNVKHCKHYSFWQDGGCHLQDWDSHLENKRNAKTGPPTCCATPRVRFDYDDRRRRRGNRRRSPQLDMSGQGRTKEDALHHCQRRCQRVNGCHHFTYWPDGGCHLTGENALALPDNDRKPTVAGAPWCNED